MWFRIKKDNKCISGSKHIFWFIQSTRNLPLKLLEKVKQSLEINGYFIHPEKILLTVLVDERRQIRHRVVEIILKVRMNKNDDVRKFLILNINFNAKDYPEMIDWAIDITEPPLTKDFSKAEI